MPVRWLRKALKSLEQAYQFVAAEDVEAAVQLVLRIQAAVEQLERFPQLGRVGRVEGTRELVIANTPFIVVYRVKRHNAEILRVLHSSRHYPD